MRSNVSITIDGERAKGQLGEETFQALLKRISKNANGQAGRDLAESVGNVERNTIKARLGSRGYKGYKNTGIASEALKQSVALKRSSTRSRKGKNNVTIRMSHKVKFLRRGFMIGETDESKFPTGSTPYMLSKMTKWVRMKKARGARFYLKEGDKRKGQKDVTRIARRIIFAWKYKVSQSRLVLPKWYDVVNNKPEEFEDKFFNSQMVRRRINNLFNK